MSLLAKPKPKPKGFPRPLWSLLQSESERAWASFHFPTLSPPQQADFQSLWTGHLSKGRNLGLWHPAFAKALWAAHGGTKNEREYLSHAWSKLDDESKRVLEMLGWSVKKMARQYRTFEEDMASSPIAGAVGQTVYL